MIAYATVGVLRLKRWFDRAYWALRVRTFPKAQAADCSPSSPSLVIIQIDGLSQPQFRTALARGRMPFLRKLIQREKYVQHAHYSGLPSATP